MVANKDLLHKELKWSWKGVADSKPAIEEKSGRLEAAGARMHKLKKTQ